MFFKTPTEKAADRLIEEQLYAQVAKELADNKQNIGIWAKAIAKSKGDEIKAKGLYIEYRVQSIKDELVIKEELTKVHVKEKPYTTVTPKQKTSPESEKEEEEYKRIEIKFTLIFIGLSVLLLIATILFS